MNNSVPASVSVACTRVLCIDYGGKNIGFAVSDHLGYTAQPLDIFRREDENSCRPLLNKIAEMVENLNINKIVLGYPKQLNGTEGKSCENVLKFKAKLSGRLPKTEVVLEDERLSTVGVSRAITEAGLDHRKKYDIVDKMAAAYILQGYLDKLRKGETKMTNNDNLNEELDEFEDDEEMDIITLTSDDGEEYQCIVIDDCEYKGSSYLLVVEAEEIDEEDASANILKETKQEDDTYVYEFIEDDDEFTAISAIFDKQAEDYEIE